MEEIKTNGRTLYKCDVCGKVGNWDKEWQWFGSYFEAENGRPLLYVCSTKCRGDMTDFAAGNLLKIKQKAIDRLARPTDLQIREYPNNG